MQQLLKSFIKHFKFDPAKTEVDVSILYTYDPKLDAKPGVENQGPGLFSRLYEKDLQEEFKSYGFIKFVREEKS